MKISKKFYVWLITFSMLAGMMSFPVYAANGATIYGSGNAGQDSTITAGGEYTIADGATGVITIATTEDVILTGKGVESGDAFANLGIEYSVSGANLTLRNVFISNESAKSVIKFDGEKNVLNIDGTCVIDHNIGGSPNAAIHVDNDDSLKITGDGDFYLYKSAQGSGIGGDTGQLNGKITFDMNGRMFGKGTKQGALIGAGANSASSGTPGEIEFVNGFYNLMTNSRGGCVGGSAGADGASAGTKVTIDKDACVNINVDWTGSAIGGGGYAAGNDSSGGTLIINGGSLRCYIDENAKEQWGLEQSGVNDKAITAQKQNAEQKPLYLLKFDTTSLGDTGSYDVSVDGADFYSGPNHEYGYVNESAIKEEQTTPGSTMENWYENGEKNLYFYVTGEDHELLVNGEIFHAKWDSESATFEVTEAEDSCSTYFDKVSAEKIAKDGTFTADLYVKSEVIPGAAQMKLSVTNGSITSVDLSKDFENILSGNNMISFYGNELSAKDGLKVATVTVAADNSGKDVLLSVTDGIWTQVDGIDDIQLSLEDASSVTVGIYTSDLVSCTSYGNGYYLVQYKGEVEEGKTAVYNGQNMKYSEPLKAWVILSETDVSETIVNDDVTTAAAEGSVETVDYSGDVNANGKINIIDAQIAYDLSCGNVYSGDTVLPMLYRADANADGAVQAGDARTIQMIVHGKAAL